MNPLETTNGLLAVTVAHVNQLITWAEADRDSSIESNAREQAARDRERARKLTRARNLLAECER